MSKIITIDEVDAKDIRVRLNELASRLKHEYRSRAPGQELELAYQEEIAEVISLAEMLRVKLGMEER